MKKESNNKPWVEKQYQKKKKIKWGEKDLEKSSRGIKLDWRRYISLT